MPGLGRGPPLPARVMPGPAGRGGMAVGPGLGRGRPVGAPRRRHRRHRRGCCRRGVRASALPAGGRPSPDRMAEGSTPAGRPRSGWAPPRPSGSAPQPRRVRAPVPASVPAKSVLAVRGAELARGGRGRKGLPQPPSHRGLDRRRSALYELAEFAELGEYILARDVELLGELVYAGLACHWTP